MRSKVRPTGFRHSGAPHTISWLLSRAPRRGRRQPRSPLRGGLQPAGSVARRLVSRASRPFSDVNAKSHPVHPGGASAPGRRVRGGTQTHRLDKIVALAGPFGASGRDDPLCERRSRPPSRLPFSAAADCLHRPKAAPWPPPPSGRQTRASLVRAGKVIRGRLRRGTILGRIPRTGSVTSFVRA